MIRCFGYIVKKREVGDISTNAHATWTGFYPFKLFVIPVWAFIRISF